MDKLIEKKVWYRVPKNLIVIGVVLLIPIAYLIFFSDRHSRLNVDIEKITIETVARDTFQDYIATIGTVFPIRTIYLDAAEGGRVDEVVREEGAILVEGEVILRLSNPNLNLSILNSEAELAEKSNFLRNTRVTMEQDKLLLNQQIIELHYRLLRLKRDFEKNSKFFNEGLISEEDYLKSKEDYEYSSAISKLLLERQIQDSIYRKVQIEQLESSLDRMKLNLELVRLRFENMEVRAPSNGQLGLLNAEIGEQKNQGERLGLINDLSSFKIQAEIDEHYISRISAGLFANFEYEGANYKLKLKKVYPEVRNGRFKIDLTFDGDMPKNIRTGQTFRLKLELGESKIAILVPRGGFFQSTGGQWIFVVDPTGRFAMKREIKIGRQNPNYYEVISGLDPNEQVIISNYDIFGEVDKLILKR